ncbi:uncharacterized protein LOC144659615 isoform X1 [Oculina patagonica]
MNQLALFLCFYILSFAFSAPSQPNEEKLSYVLMVKFSTKRDVDAQALDKEFSPPPVESGRKREAGEPLTEGNFTLPYIRPIEFGKKREPTKILTEGNFTLPYIGLLNLEEEGTYKNFNGEQFYASLHTVNRIWKKEELRRAF